MWGMKYEKKANVNAKIPETDPVTAASESVTEARHVIDVTAARRVTRSRDPIQPPMYDEAVMSGKVLGRKLGAIPKGCPAPLCGMILQLKPASPKVPSAPGTCS